MASALLQERLLGFTLGFAGGLGALIYEQKHLWRSTGDVADVYSGGKLPPAQIYVPEPIFGRRAQEQLIHAWNVGVDRTLGRLVVALSVRGCWWFVLPTTLPWKIEGPSNITMRYLDLGLTLECAEAIIRSPLWG